MAKNADISTYTIQYRVNAAAFYISSDKSRHAMKLVRDRLREMYDVEPPEHRIIKLWSEKLLETGSIFDRPRCGRPTEKGDHIDAVKESVRDEPTKSIRRMSDELNVDKSTVHRILKKDLALKAWKPTKVQFLSGDDHADRVRCCNAILLAYPTMYQFRKLFFSDECAIYVTGKLENVVFWSAENPHFHQQVSQYPPSLMIWAAISNAHLIGPYFVQGTMTSERYIAMLKEKFIPDLERRGIRDCHFQQDGAPSHTALATRSFLNVKFPNKWVGKFGPVPWPARSPDLTSADNALWGIVKKYVKLQRPTGKEEIRQAVCGAFENFDLNTLPSIHSRTYRRLSLCVEKGGVQVDPFE